jgi:hypothetical protein
MARIEIAEGIGDPNDGTIERVLGISGGFDKGFAQE